MQLFAHHGCQPRPRTARNHVHHIGEQLAAESFRLVDLTDLLALRLRVVAHFATLTCLLGQVTVPLRNTRRIRHRAHRNRLGDRRGQPRRQDDERARTSRRQTERDAEHINQAVLTAKDHVA